MDHGNLVPLSSHKEIIVVSGQPRSGTSLMMRILAESGFPVVADENLSYETASTTSEYLPQWLHNLPYHRSPLPLCVKILYPLVLRVPIGDIFYNFLWMCRDPKEQAKSQRKFRISKGENIHRTAIHLMEKCIKRVESITPNVMGCVVRSRVIRVRFENLLDRSPSLLKSLEDFIGTPLNLQSIKPRNHSGHLYTVGHFESRV